MGRSIESATVVFESGGMNYEGAVFILQSGWVELLDRDELQPPHKIKLIHNGG